MFTAWLRRLFRPAGEPAPAPQVKARAAGTPRQTYAHTVSHALQRNFQRTVRDFVPRLPESAQACSMDAEFEQLAALPDVYGFATGLPQAVVGFVAGQGFIGHQMAALLAQNWLIGKACGQPARDAVQHGYTVAVAGEGLADDKAASLKKEVERLDAAMGILTHCRELVRNARIFGIRHALFVVDGTDYSQPFNLDGVTPGSYRGISQIDPYWLTPELDFSALACPENANFYEPTYWRLPSGLRVHRSHFVTIRTEEVPDVLKPTYYYGGIPLPQRIVERVYAAERTANEAPELALTKRTTTIQGEIDNYLTDEGEVKDRLRAFAEIRDNYGFLVLGENETLTQSDTSLADFDALIMTQYQLVAAISNMPATKLLGTSPKGFNATGEHETKAYREELATIQTNDMTPLLLRHHALLAASALGNGGVEITHTWNAEQPTPAELAELNSKKATTAQTLINAGALTPEEERARLKSDSTSGYTALETGPTGPAGETTGADDEAALAALLESIGAEEYGGENV